MKRANSSELKRMSELPSKPLIINTSFCTLNSQARKEENHKRIVVGGSAALMSRMPRQLSSSQRQSS